MKTWMFALIAALFVAPAAMAETGAEEMEIAQSGAAVVAEQAAEAAEDAAEDMHDEEMHDEEHDDEHHEEEAAH